MFHMKHLGMFSGGGEETENMGLFLVFLKWLL